jgi:hypothetical protein
MAISLVAAPPASADGTILITAGPAQYRLSYTHPTGTITVAGGTISARCTAQSFVGSAFFATPRCSTRLISCPTTANYCTLALSFQENAVRGPVEFAAGAIASSGSFALYTEQQPYNCPQANNCGWRVHFGYMSPGATIQIAIVNLRNNNYPNVFAQASITIF